MDAAQIIHVQPEIQKQFAALQEQLGILVVRSVSRVRIDDQLGVRDVLQHDPGFDRRGHDVARTAHREGRLLDRRPFGKALALDLTPLGDSLVSSLRDLLRGRRIDVELAFAPVATNRLAAAPVDQAGDLTDLRMSEQ